MLALLEWCYCRRDPISFLGAGFLIVAALLIGRLPAFHKPNSPSLEMAAMLETPAPPPQIKELPRPEPVPVPVAQPRRIAPQAMPLAPQPLSSADPSPDAPPRSVSPVSAAPGPAVAQAPPALPPAQTVPGPVPVQPPVGVAASAQYEAQILAYLERVKRYPTSREARLTRPAGTTRFWFELNRMGLLLGSGLLTSSGSNLLDAEALRTLRTGAFPAFPESAYAGETNHRFIAALKYEVGDTSSQ